ncbi:MAG: CBS domain-containing protein [Thermoproteota archaeon]
MGDHKEAGSEYPSIIDLAYKEYKRYLKVQEVMTKDVVTIATEAMVSESAKIMGEKHIGSLIAVKYETPVGIITERDLLSKVLARGLDLKKLTVENIMSYPLIKICPTTQIREAAQTMIKKKGRLTVFECGNLVGIITASDLIRRLPEAPETMVKVDDFMTRSVETADEKTRVSTVAKLMGEKRIGSVIITSKGEPMGIFTERDLLTSFLAKERPLSAEVGESSSSPLVTAPLGISVREAGHIMASKHIRRLPIVKDGKIVGIVTARDLVEAYAK